ncbi:ribonuclease VapC [Geomonas sp. Red276]
MANIILDTNVISELMRQKPDETVLDWFAHRQADVFYITAIVQSEIALGISLLPPGKRRDALAAAAEGMFSDEFVDRCLPFDAECADLYASVVSASRQSGISMTTEDAQIAAIALSVGYPLATRNVKDFQHISGLSIHDPWRRS